ncbi:unnamed protein product, partial [Staurois parvus]
YLLCAGVLHREAPDLLSSPNGALCSSSSPYATIESHFAMVAHTVVAKIIQPPLKLKLAEIRSTYGRLYS